MKVKEGDPVVAKRARFVPNDSPCEDPKLKAALEAAAEGCEVELVEMDDRPATKTDNVR